MLYICFQIVKTFFQNTLLHTKFRINLIFNSDSVAAYTSNSTNFVTIYVQSIVRNKYYLYVVIFLGVLFNI